MQIDFTQDELNFIIGVMDTKHKDTEIAQDILDKIRQGEVTQQGRKLYDGINKSEQV